MPEVGEVFQEVFFVEAKPPEANEIAAAQADAVTTIHLEQISCAPYFFVMAAGRHVLQSGCDWHSFSMSFGFSASHQAANQAPVQAAQVECLYLPSRPKDAINAGSTHHTAVMPLPMLQVRAS